jgi:ectoine hydroxylase-related dioxygenase (phytanoyl-CoA dioxygenase family)
MKESGRKLKNKLERDGFAIVPGLIDSATIKELIRALELTEGGESLRKRESSTYAIRNLLTTVTAVKELAQSAPVRSVIEEVLGPDAFAVRGLLFDKTPAANWKVAWHQDLTIAVKQHAQVEGYGPWSIKAGIHHVQPPAAVLEQMLTLRLHLDDCTETNGPLQVVPGSHRSGKLKAEDIQKWRVSASAETCRVKSGGILLMRPLLLHASSAAQRPGHRRVVHLEFAARRLEGGLEWCD